MTTYRALVHYNFKKGMEKQGIKFLENELIKKAQELGCHNIELLHSEHDPSYVIGIGHWNNIEEARAFQSHWNSKEKELVSYCRNTPKREFFKIEATYFEKKRKAA